MVITIKCHYSIVYSNVILLSSCSLISVSQTKSIIEFVQMEWRHDGSDRPLNSCSGDFDGLIACCANT